MLKVITKHNPYLLAMLNSDKVVLINQLQKLINKIVKYHNLAESSNDYDTYERYISIQTQARYNLCKFLTDNCEVTFELTNHWNTLQYSIKQQDNNAIIGYAGIDLVVL